MAEPSLSLLQRLAARSSIDIKGQSAYWRIRMLTPVEAAELGMGMSMLQGLVKTTATDTRSSAQRLKDNPEKVALAAAHMQTLACSVVYAASADGETWSDIVLVDDIRKQSTTSQPGRLYVGAVSAEDVSAIAVASSRNYREARAAAQPFQRPDDPPSP